MKRETIKKILRWLDDLLLSCILYDINHNIYLSLISQSDQQYIVYFDILISFHFIQQHNYKQVFNYNCETFQRLLSTMQTLSLAYSYDILLVK